MEIATNVGTVQEAWASRGQVMVVDDDPESLCLIERKLGLGGYAVRSFSGGQAALSAASENPPELILLDVGMPDMNGYEVCERLKSSAQLSQIPVIFVSARNSPEDRLQGFQYGGIDYVAKPFHFDEVKARIDSHVKLRRLQQQMETDSGRLRDLIEIQNKRIEQGHSETLFAIAKVAEARDDKTGKHQERVQHFCKLLATGLSAQPKYRKLIDSTWISDLFRASSLHDIGKVAIPDRILLKPGPLTPEEFTIMKTHATLGAQMLRDVRDRYPDNAFITMGIEAAQWHHERWDGGGYPDGLAGEDIPLCARILAVADTYDAIRSRRCYKVPSRHELTCAVIIAESGRHFDPAITAVFNDLADEFREFWTQMDFDVHARVNGED